MTEKEARPTPKATQKKSSAKKSNGSGTPPISAEASQRYLDEHGPERALEWYRNMLLQRRFEEQAGRAYQMGKIKGFCHLYIGQEAVAAGAMAAILERDYVITAYREHGQALARGMDANGVMSELFGKATGCSKGKGGSMHLFDREKNFLGGWGIVGGQIPTAAGVAFAAKYRDEDAVCLCFFGEGSIHQGVVHETFNMAAKWGLPVVFIIENNRYAMGTAIERISAVLDLTKKAVGYDMDAETVDGQDFFAVWDAVDRAVVRARKENKPTLLDVKTYRYRGHSMSDPAKYRTKDEVEAEQQRDPIMRLTNFAIEKKLASQEELDGWDAEAKNTVKESIKFADESPFPDPSELTTDVYVDWPWEYE